MRRIAYGFMWLFAASIPMQEIAASILVDVSGTFSRLVGLAATVVAVAALIYEGRLRPFGVVHGIIILFLAWGGFSFLWSADQDATLARMLTNVQLAMMVILFAQFGSTKDENQGLIVAYVFGASASLIELFRRYMTGEAFQIGIFMDRYTAFNNNPNDYALALAIGIPMAWFLVIEGRKRWEVVLGYLYMCFGSVGVVMTGSRGGLIAAFFGAMILPFSLMRLSRGKKAITFGFLIIAIYLGVQVTPTRVLTRLETLEDYAPSAVPDTYYGELEGPNIRMVLWKQGFREFFNHPRVAVAGVGASAYMAGVEPIYGERYVAHNVFVSILVEQGIIGFTLFLIIMYLILSPMRYLEATERYLWIFSFLSWAVGVSFITWEQTKNTWFLIGVLAARLVEAKRTSPKKPGLIASILGRGGLRLHMR